MTLLEAASRLEREADKYESNSCGMTDAEGQLYDDGWLQGICDAADYLKRWAAGLDGVGRTMEGADSD